ncbi:MAG: formyltetrahydrofolate deformylase [Caulobacteraceae bacterium]
MRRTYIVTLICPDRIGIVADVAGCLAGQGCNILESAQFGDGVQGRFFMRSVVEAPNPLTLDALRNAFAPVAARYGMDVRFHDQATPTPTVVMVSKLGHCLNDLLFRTRIGAVPIDIRAVISNHEALRDLAEAAGVVFHHLPMEQGKAVQEARLVEAVESVGAELIVLARYMQVLSPGLCERWSGRVINIHHSFLPSFKGAKPYHRAHALGVKLIGATAHYVTGDLDEGPIIEQAVERVQHSLTIDDFTAVGRDVEAVVLARAVKWHAERRILINGGRTVVFP